MKKCDCDLVFIHGTGVREPAYSKAFSIISQKLKERNENLCFHKCYWGGSLGTTLKIFTCHAMVFPLTKGSSFNSLVQFVFLLPFSWVLRLIAFRCSYNMLGSFFFFYIVFLCIGVSAVLLHPLCSLSLPPFLCPLNVLPLLPVPPIL